MLCNERSNALHSSIGRLRASCVSLLAMAKAGARLGECHQHLPTLCAAYWACTGPCPVRHHSPYHGATTTCAIQHPWAASACQTLLYARRLRAACPERGLARASQLLKPACAHAQLCEQSASGICTPTNASSVASSFSCLQPLWPLACSCEPGRLCGVPGVPNASGAACYMSLFDSAANASCAKWPSRLGISQRLQTSCANPGQQLLHQPQRHARRPHLHWNGLLTCTR